MPAVVISGFPGVGKSYAASNNVKYKILDLESSEYSWIKSRKPDGSKNRNPKFPGNYIEAIIKNLDKYDAILVSSHLYVREAMYDANIKYNLAIPYSTLREHYIHRFINRESDVKLIKAVMNNWYDWLDDIISREFNRCRIHYLDYNEYLSDIINDIIDTSKYLDEKR